MQGWDCRLYIALHCNKLTHNVEEGILDQWRIGGDLRHDHDDMTLTKLNFPPDTRRGPHLFSW